MTAQARLAAERINPGALKVLVVDDSRMQRRLLSAQLTRAGYEVIEAASGEDALLICAVQEPDIILSDWLMPGMSGIDFCRIFRRMERSAYGYFILLTSKTEKTDITLGLESGADDFLAKPASTDELRARLTAGERILTMERQLKEKNQMISSALAELQGLYDSINRDLIEARRLQQSLVREKFRSFGSAQVSLLLRPSGHVGGDLVGFFPINARRVGLYGIDVAGHGITSALMTARLSGYLSGVSPDQNIAMIQTDLGLYDALPPDELAASLNEIVLKEIRADSYFTLIYADVDLISGEVAMVQAGHPMPAVLRRDGNVEFLGSGGLPIGLIEDARYDMITTRLAPGDRLFLGSDGITEAATPDGMLLEDDGLEQLLRAESHLRGPDFLDALQRDLVAYAETPLTDDISAVFFEFDGPKLNAD